MTSSTCLRHRYATCRRAKLSRHSARLCLLHLLIGFHGQPFASILLVVSAPIRPFVHVFTWNSHVLHLLVSARLTPVGACANGQSKQLPWCVLLTRPCQNEMALSRYANSLS